MKADRAALLFVAGALSAITAWAVYLVVIFVRYSLPVPNLADRMWLLFILVPGFVGGCAALFYPFVQRSLKLRSSALVAVFMSLIIALVAKVVLSAVTGFKTVIIALCDLDFLIWLLCAILGGLIFTALRIISGDTKRSEADIIGRLRRTFGFKPDATENVRGIALVLDIQGFAVFFNQPWAKSSVPRYLDLVLSAVTTELFGGKRFWGDEATVSSFPNPIHQKFLGDGMLFIWTPPEGQKYFSDSFVSELVTRLVGFQDQFPEINQAIRGPIPYSFTLPERVRFGVAAGPMFELVRKDSSTKEYMGFCINLASRLQGYCRDGLSVLASTKLDIPEETMEELDLVQVVAKSIKGFEVEAIAVPRYEYEQLSDLRKSTLFVVDE